MMDIEEIRREMESWENLFNEAKKLLKPDEYKYSYCYMKYQKYKKMYEEKINGNNKEKIRVNTSN